MSFPEREDSPTRNSHCGQYIQIGGTRSYHWALNLYKYVEFKTLSFPSITRSGQ